MGKGQAIRIIREFVNALKREGITIDRVVLYGSYVKGTVRPDSDIDVAVISKDFGKDRVEEGMLLYRIAGKIDPRLEPVPFSTKTYEKDTWIPSSMKSGKKVKNSKYHELFCIVIGLTDNVKSHLDYRVTPFNGCMVRKRPLTTIREKIKGQRARTVHSAHGLAPARKRSFLSGKEYSLDRCPLMGTDLSLERFWGSTITGRNRASRFLMPPLWDLRETQTHPSLPHSSVTF